MKLPGIEQLLLHPTLQAIRAGKQPGILLLDYDGTLAPFREQRDQAFPYPGVREILSRLPASGPGRFILVSGRDAPEAVRLLGLSPPPEVWGCHGAQRRLPSGEIQSLMLSREQENFLQNAATMLGNGAPDALERKPCSLAFHVRGLAERKQAWLLEWVESAWQLSANRLGLELHPFDGGLEIRLPGIDKGRAITTLAEENPGHALVYLGDDRTDEDAFAALRDGDIGILVSERLKHTAASFRITPPTELLSFLEAWQSTRLHRQLLKTTQK